jgi:hypothetical protein
MSLALIESPEDTVQCTWRETQAPEVAAGMPTEASRQIQDRASQPVPGTPKCRQKAPQRVTMIRVLRAEEVI